MSPSPPEPDPELLLGRASDHQVLSAARRLIAAWNERPSRRMPLLFAPTIRRLARGPPTISYIAPPAASRETLTCARSTATARPRDTQRLRRPAMKKPRRVRPGLLFR